MEEINLTSRKVPLLGPQDQPVGLGTSQAVGSLLGCDSPFSCASAAQSPVAEQPFLMYPLRGERGWVWWQHRVSCVCCVCCRANPAEPEGFLLSFVPGQTSENRLQPLSVEKQTYQQQQEHLGKSHQCHVFLSPYKGSYISKCKKIPQ